MANTVDILGDDAVMDSIITKSITEIVDDTVTKVGDRAFYNCGSLTDVQIPNASSIGQNSFMGCTSLKNVNFPIVNDVAAYSFKNCNALTIANIPKSVNIGSNCFENCTALTTVNIPAATEISPGAFVKCTSLTSIDLPAVNQFVGINTFLNCSKLTAVILRNAEQVCNIISSDASVFSGTPIASGTGYVYVPKALVNQYKADAKWSTYASQIRAIEDYPEITVDFDAVTEIAANEFNGSAITTANFPNCVTIGGYAFQDCTSLTTANFPAATTASGLYAFAGCTKLKTINFPLLTNVNHMMFMDCGALVEANFPAATNIGNYAFRNCTSLKTASFPLVTSVGSDSFEECTELLTLDFPSVTTIDRLAFQMSYVSTLILRHGGVVTVDGKVSFNASPIANSTTEGYIYVPRALVDSYKAATSWATYAAKFRALEDYTVDGTTTGELDESKI